jgi:hypothetical protein
MAQGLHLLSRRIKWLEWKSYRNEEQSKEFQGPWRRDKVEWELMSCRIDRTVTRKQLVVLRISGQITGEHVDTLRAVLEQEGKTVAIDLQDVLLVNHEAVTLLALCENNGTELRNCPAYIREWVTKERESR